MEENKIMERIIQRQIKANERILREIGKVIGDIGELTPSEAYTIAQQLKYGESLERIIKILAKNSHLTELDIYEMLEKEAKINLGLKKAYFDAKKIDFIPYKENASLKNLVREIAMTTIGTYRNMSMTTGLTFLDANKRPLTRPIQQAYWEIVDDAIMNVNTGKQSFWQAMTDQLETIGEAGIQSIEYESGHHRRIDSALRMNLQDGLNELAIRQQELIGSQFGSDGWEISVHENPADDHADVQGHIFTNEEYNKLQTFGMAKDINGRTYDMTTKYGFRPIGELNCYHYAYSIVIGVSKPRYTEKELAKIKETNNKGFTFEGKHYTNYQGTQLQRRIETEIRKAQETNILAKAGGDQTLIEKSERKTDMLVNKYYKLHKESNLPTRLERIRNNIKK